MSGYKAVVHGMLIDGTGADPVDDSAVLVKANRIVKIGEAGSVEIPDGADVIDATGKTVMPGIIEGHAHIGGTPSAQKVLRVSLQRGITTVCDVSSNLSGIVLRDAIEKGDVRGCSRLISGCMVTCTHGHVKFRTADGPWEVRKAVREMIMAGADFVKTAASGGFSDAHGTCSDRNYTYEELEALCDEAHGWGKPVVAHCHIQPGLDNCIRAEVDQIHHGAFIDDGAVRGIKDAGIYYIPTLAVTCKRNIIAKAGRPWETDEMKEAQPIHRAGVRLAHSLGVKVGLGTDYPGTAATWKVGDRSMWELQELEACGMTPMEAIVAGTRTNAEAYGKLDDFGTLEVGKRADILVVDGNPLDDLAVLYDAKNLNIVMKDGQVESADEDHVQYFTIKEDPDYRSEELQRKGPAAPFVQGN